MAAETLHNSPPGHLRSLAAGAHGGKAVLLQYSDPISVVPSQPGPGRPWCNRELRVVLWQLCVTWANSHGLGDEQGQQHARVLEG